jgi:hypothetical protein
VAEVLEDEATPIRWGLGDAIFGVVASIVLSVVAVAVAVGITGDEIDDLPLWGTAVLQIPLWGALLGVAWWAATRKGSGSLREDFRVWFKPRDVPIGIAAGLGGQLLIGLVVVVLYDALGIDTDRLGESAKDLTDRAVGGVDVVVLLLIVAIGAPIVEEIFYRGLWLRSLERRTGSRRAAVVISSVVFGVIHFQPYDLLALSLAGLVFAWLATRYERLGPAIVAHLAFNLTAVISLLSSS